MFTRGVSTAQEKQLDFAKQQTTKVLLRESQEYSLLWRISSRFILFSFVLKPLSEHKQVNEMFCV